MRIEAVDLTTNAAPQDRPVRRIGDVERIRVSDRDVTVYFDDRDPQTFDSADWIVWVSDDTAPAVIREREA